MDYYPLMYTLQKLVFTRSVLKSELQAEIDYLHSIGATAVTVLPVVVD